MCCGVVSVTSLYSWGLDGILLSQITSHPFLLSMSPHLNHKFSMSQETPGSLSLYGPVSFPLHNIVLLQFRLWLIVLWSEFPCVPFRLLLVGLVLHYSNRCYESEWVQVRVFQALFCQSMIVRSAVCTSEVFQISVSVVWCPHILSVCRKSLCSVSSPELCVDVTMMCFSLPCMVSLTT